MSAAVIPMLILLVIAFVLPFIVGVYVYRDAGRRGMNSLLWALVTALGPALVGLIIYLLVRGNYSDLRCPQCDGTVTEQFVVCPKCGAKLRAACPNCAMPIESDWRVCPKCTQPLVGVQMDVQAPVRAKDRSLGKVLAVVLIVPVLLITILVLSLSAFLSDESSALRAEPVEDYFAEMHPYNDEALIAYKVRNWLNKIELQSDQAHALRYDYSHESGKEYFYLVYVPGAGHQEEPIMKHSSSIFGTTLTLDLHGNRSEGCLYNISFSGKKAPKLKIILDGKRLPCEVTTVDYNPTLYFIEPQYDEVDFGEVSFLLPQRITVVKLVNGHRGDFVYLTDPYMEHDILSAIDGAAYLDWTSEMYWKYRKNDISEEYDIKDGFDIIIEYKVEEPFEDYPSTQHDNMLHCIAFEQQGSYYLIDGRSEDGSYIREMDEQFYNTLISLFE